MKAFIIGVLTVFLSPYLSYAEGSGKGLVFEKTFQSFSPDPSVAEVESVYKFTNQSDYPITIESIKTSCGCTTAELEKKTYNPGETGEIKAYFNLGGRQGLQQKKIRVTTDYFENPESILTLEVRIPEILIFSSRFVAWERGQSVHPKTITLTVAEGVETVSITEVTCPGDIFEVEVDVIEPGRQYQIKVTPVDVEDAKNALIEIKTDFPQNNPKTFYAHAFIR